MFSYHIAGFFGQFIVHLFQDSLALLAICSQAIQIEDNVCTDTQHDYLLASLSEINAKLERRVDIYQSVPVSDTLSFPIDYKDRLYLFVRSSVAMTLTIAGSIFTLPGETWVPVRARPGEQAFTLGFGNVAALISLLATDNDTQMPLSNIGIGQQGALTITGQLVAGQDNLLTFSGQSTLARRLRIQNESAGVLYWALDQVASSGSASLAAPAANAVMVEWVYIATSVLHIFVPGGGTTLLNASGGLKVGAWS